MVQYMDNAMGNRIRELRIANGYTQEELAKHFGMNKAAINKWETGLVENIPRSKIQELARLFGCDACYIMAFDSDPTKEKEKKICDLMYKCYGKDAYSMVQMYFKLNQTGKEKALERIQELTKISDYTVIEKRDMKDKVI